MNPFHRTLLIATTLFVAAGAVAAPADDAAAIRKYPFAMCSNPGILHNKVYSELMLDAGATMCRLDVTFGAVRPQAGDNPGQWQWGAMEKLRELRRRQPRLHWLVLLGYGPAWAADPKFTDPNPPKVGPPPFNCPQRGIDVRPVENPRNLYGHYVYEMVRRYKDVTTFWESWNEPDLPLHHYFKGNGTDFFAYQKVCYLAAKKADPTCQILFAGMCYPTFEGYLATHQLKPPTPYPAASSFFEDYLKACVADPEAKANNYYFDIMNQHSYSRASDLYDYVAVLRRLMQDYLKQQKPVWITEMGVTDKGGMFGVSPEEYCDYQLQSFAWGSLAGVEKFFHFQLDNSNGHGLYAGMLDKPKPVLTTYRDVLVKEFADARLVKQRRQGSGLPGRPFPIRSFMEGRLQRL